MIGPSAKLIESRSTRVIDAIHGHVQEVAGEKIAIASYRIADNIDRRLSGRPMLDSELRDRWKQRWAKQ
ncbi:hypothetical protein [Nitratifractor sp.]|uniref:hypothetical protein n=1 Tax=Nitratifractor sp. TaxID=2268144 RepID=UPI0025FC22F0|nr:hypothetical protein [Nitratifractor sp.]